MRENSVKPDVFSYLDYRHFLNDTCRQLASIQKVSLRSFARMAGSSSPNWLQLITVRKLNISPAGIKSLCESLFLTRKEQNFLALLVSFDHAKTNTEKDRIFKRILSSRAGAGIKRMHADQYEYFGSWYNPAVRELAVHRDFDGTPGWIADRIVPSVSPGKIKKSIALLEQLKLIKIDAGTGRYVQSAGSISTPDEVLSLAVMNYHKAVLKVGAEALESTPAPQRDYRAVTMGVSPAKFKEIKKRLNTFWKEILDEVKNEQPDEVYQMNIQLYPVTRKKRTRKKRK